MMLFHAFIIRHFVISVAAVSARVFFIKRILYCIAFLMQTYTATLPVLNFNVFILVN